jgi:CelD/BcsL family acetyltransferase involved in cellulose biosynthesis
VQTLLERLRASGDPDFGGAVFSLRDGERIVAVEFGLRAGGVYHSWFPAFDRAYAELSPGLLLLEKMIEAAPGMGLHKIDLGPGESHYKKYYSNRLTPLYEGLATGPTSLGRAHAGGFTLWRSLEAAPLGARLRRRLDQIAACEPTAVGRVRGVIAAAGALRAA